MKITDTQRVYIKNKLGVLGQKKSMAKNTMDWRNILILPKIFDWIKVFLPWAKTDISALAASSSINSKSSH